jgi:uncharacterized protein
MFVAAARVTLRLDASQSLKDKRQVVRSLLQRLRNEFNVTAAEVATQEKLRLATLGLAYVSGDASHAEDVLDNALRYIEETRPDVEISAVARDLFSLED